MSSFLLYLLLLASSLTTAPLPNSEHTIEVTQLQEDLYLYRSFAIYEGERVSANGLVAVSGEEVALIDTPWDEAQTRQLLQWVEEEIKKPVSFAIITHAHMDRIGGIEVVKTEGIPTISGEHTSRAAIKNGYSSPDHSFRTDTLLTYGTASLEAYYPGGGHTVDNTVVYLNDQDILYGGCFIKGAAATSLGNTADADVQSWPRSLQKVKERYAQRKQVIPGHGSLEPGAIENTLQLLSEER